MAVMWVSNSSNLKKASGVYRYSDSKIMILAGCFFFLFFLVMLYMFLWRDVSYDAYLYFMPFLFIIGCANIFVVLGCSDVEINGECISRRIFGCLIQMVLWCDVSLIRIFDMCDNNKMRLALHVFSKKNEKFPLFMNGKISFGDRPMNHGNFKNLIKDMNSHIEVHKIKIESSIDGKISYPNALIDRI